MLTAEMDAPVAANSHAAEIDMIILGFLPSSHLARRVARTATVYFKADDERGWFCPVRVKNKQIGQEPEPVLCSTQGQRWECRDAQTWRCHAEMKVECSRRGAVSRDSDVDSDELKNSKIDLKINQP
jgi:hypothetical protein